MARACLQWQEWLVLLEDDLYLHLVDRGVEQRERRIIDKATGEVMREKETPRAAGAAAGR